MTERVAIFPTQVGLQHGSQGAEVQTLQLYLSRFGYLAAETDAGAIERMRSRSETPQDGIFDDTTAHALRAFQSFNGLPPTGELDDDTVAHMAVPRCGTPDLWDISDLSLPEGAMRFVVQGNIWSRDFLRYGFENFTPDVPEGAVRDAVVQALGLWDEVTPLSFREVPIDQDPEIRIRFVRGNHGDGAVNAFDGVGGVLAHAFYPPPNGGDIAGDAHFDEAEPWSTDIPVPADRFDFVTIAAHEFGHSLGLDHSTVPGAIMRSAFPRGAAQRFLGDDDIAGIQSLYNHQVRVPMVQEMSPSVAAETIRAVGLVPIFGGSQGRNPWVWKQSPRAGARVEPGSPVSLQLRSGPIP